MDERNRASANLRLSEFQCLVDERDAARARVCFLEEQNADLLSRLKLAERDRDGLKLDVGALVAQRDEAVVLVTAIKERKSLERCTDCRVNALKKSLLDLTSQYKEDLARFGFERSLCVYLHYKNEDLTQTVASAEAAKACLLKRCTAAESCA